MKVKFKKDCHLGKGYDLINASKGDIQHWDYEFYDKFCDLGNEYFEVSYLDKQKFKLWGRFIGGKKVNHRENLFFAMAFAFSLQLLSAGTFVFGFTALSICLSLVSAAIVAILIKLSEPTKQTPIDCSMKDFNTYGPGTSLKLERKFGHEKILLHRGNKSSV